MLLNTAEGPQFFLPLLGLFLGDMLEILVATCNLSCNFSRIAAVCHTCSVPGSAISDYKNWTKFDLRDMSENAKLILEAQEHLRNGSVTKVVELSTKYSLLPVKVTKTFTTNDFSQNTQNGFAGHPLVNALMFHYDPDHTFAGTQKKLFIFSSFLLFLVLFLVSFVCF